LEKKGEKERKEKGKRRGGVELQQT